MRKQIRISFKAVLAGGAADVFSTYLLLTLLWSFVMIKKGFTEMRPEIVGPQINNVIVNSPVLFGIQTIFGLACSILGGYVAARVAGQDEVENAIAASLIMVSFGVFRILAGDADALALNVFFTVITPFFYRLGAQVRIKQVAKPSK